MNLVVTVCFMEKINLSYTKRERYKNELSELGWYLKEIQDHSTPDGIGTYTEMLLAI